MKARFDQFFAALLLASSSRADVIVQRTGRVEGQVRAITAELVTLADNRFVPFADVSQIVFSRSPVVAQSQSLVLTDGSVLSGVLRDFGSTGVTFRSSALGPLFFPLSSVAAVCFVRNVAPEKILTAPSVGKTLAALKTGETRQGVVFGVSETRIVMRTDRGLEQIAKTDLLYLGMGKAAPRAKITLRNGDRLNMPVAWKGAMFAVTAGGDKTITLPVEALKEARFREES